MKVMNFRWVGFPTLALICSLVMWPAEQASARKIFNTVQGPTADQCRICHNDLKTFPEHITTIPNRHHLRANKPIEGLGNGSHPTRAPGDISTGKYTCLSCHEFTRNSQGFLEFKAFRDCLGCHPKSTVTGSPGKSFDDVDIVKNVHKYTGLYYQDQCENCHKSPLANFNNQLSDKVAADYDYSTHPLVSQPTPINYPCGYDAHDECSYGPSAPSFPDTAIGIDSRSSGATLASTRLTISHSTNGGNRLMLVGVAVEDNANRYVTSMTYGSQTMTLVGIEEINNKAHTEIWKLVAPPIGTANVMINFNGSVEKGAVAGVMTFTGVNQTTPLGAFASARGSDTQPTVNVSAAVGDLVFATGMHWNNPLGNPGAGETEHWELVRDKTNGAGSTKVATSTLVTMSWSSINADWALAGVAIKPNE